MAKYGLKAGDEIRAVLAPAKRPSPFWFMLPALALLGLVYVLQRRRRTTASGDQRRDPQDAIAQAPDQLVQQS